jgi:hypothetical protein
LSFVANSESPRSGLSQGESFSPEIGKRPTACQKLFDKASIRMQQGHADKSATNGTFSLRTEKKQGPGVIKGDRRISMPLLLRSLTAERFSLIA